MFNVKICCTANEGRIEAVCEAGNVLIEENTPESDKVKQRIDDIKGLWDDLKELALARQEVRIKLLTLYSSKLVFYFITHQLFCVFIKKRRVK